MATILGVSVTIGYGVSQFIDGLYAITGMQWIMDMGGEVPTPSKVGLISGLVVIMGLSIISAVSGVGRGVKYLSNLNLVLSIILLGTFVVFGSFVFAMTTYGTAMVDYILHFLSLSFNAYGPLSAEAFAAALPAEAQAHANDLMGGATNAWGSFDGFKERPEGAAAELDEATAGRGLCSRRAGPSVRLAGRLDHVLLGLVDRVLALRGPVPGAHLQGSHGARVHPGLRLRTGAGVLCMDDRSGRHRD